MTAFALRNWKELLRDKLTVLFGLGFPLILLLLLSMIQANIPVEMFAIGQLTPGVAVFGLSFIALFTALLVSKDRSTALMVRLRASPLTARDFALGYTLPLLPLAIVQLLVCYLAAVLLKLPVNARLLAAMLTALPAAVLYIAIGLLCGTLLSDRQVGGVCGALLTNVSAWLSGTWFDVKLVGKGFEAVANALPFIHAVDAGRAALRGDWTALWPELAWVAGYAAVLMALAVFVFQRRMRE